MNRFSQAKVELTGYLFLLAVGLVKTKGFGIDRVLVYPVTA